MKTKRPTLVELAPLAHYGDRSDIGAPRFLALLPQDGGRAIVVLHGRGLVCVRSIERQDNEALGAAGVPLCSDQVEPFQVHGVPYRFDFRAKTASEPAYLFASRVGTFGAGDATPSASKRLRELGEELAAFVLGMKAAAADEADRREALREVERVDSKLAEHAAEVAKLREQRAALMLQAQRFYADADGNERKLG